MDYTINAASRTTWDAFVSGSPNGHFMQSYDWGDFQAHAGWSPHYVQVVDDKSIRATALLLSRRIPGTRDSVFYAPRGPVSAAESDHANDALTAAIQEVLARHRGLFLRCDPYLPEGSAARGQLLRQGYMPLTREWTYWNAPKFVFWLDLAPTEDELLLGTAPNCRKDIRAGYKKGVEFQLGTLAELDDFYRLLAGMSSAKGIAVHEKAYYERLLRLLHDNCQAQLFVARLGSNVISAGMSIKYGSKAWLLYAASDSSYFKLRVNRTIQWEMVRWAKTAGCSRYDFRGTATGDPPDPTDPGYGVYEFKKSFGPTFVRLEGYFDLPKAKLRYSMLRYGEERILPTLYRAKVWLDARRSSSGTHLAQGAGLPPSDQV